MLPRPNGRSSALETIRASSGRDDHAGGEEQRQPQQHHQREALLRDPAAALDVVDAAEGGVHRPPERGADPERADRGDDADRRRAVADRGRGRWRASSCSTAGKSRWRSTQHVRLDVGGLEDLAEDEEDQQREREQREDEVVGDHPREAGDVLLVGALPEGAQVAPAAGPRSSPRARRHRRSTASRTASSARVASLTPIVAASAAAATPAQATSSIPPPSLGLGLAGPARARAAARAAEARRCSGAGSRRRLGGLLGVPPSASRRGLRAPGRVVGRLPKTPSGASLGVVVRRWCSSRRIPPYPRDPCAMCAQEPVQKRAAPRG